MNTLKAILLMAIWTSILGATLYFFDAHELSLIHI